MCIPWGVFSRRCSPSSALASSEILASSKTRGLHLCAEGHFLSSHARVGHSSSVLGSFQLQILEQNPVRLSERSQVYTICPGCVYMSGSWFQSLAPGKRASDLRSASVGYDCPSTFMGVLFISWGAEEIAQSVKFLLHKHGVLTLYPALIMGMYYPGAVGERGR